MEDLMQYEPEQNFYRPLAPPHTFRLLILEPGPISQPVSIHLQIFERAKAPSYDAISYVWGDPGHKVTIACDGRPFEITFNLYWALVRIRSLSERKVLWADAICINQANLQERSSEVTFMGSLYANAEKVVICMGDASDGKEFQVQSIINDTKILELGIHTPLDLPSHHPLRNDVRWYALATLTEMPWFERAWVIQEAALAKDPIVLYGRAEFGYRDLVRILKWLNASPWAIKYGLSSLFIHLEWADWRLNSHNPAFGFVDLLSHAALLSCSNPRDKVYAFLGHPLAYPLIQSNLIKVDYQKPPEQVYLELSLALIQINGLRVLTTVEHTPSTILEDFPSWVTRWDISLVMNDIFRVPNTRFFASTLLGQPSQPPFFSGKSLVVEGILIDKIQHSHMVYVGSSSGIIFENCQTGERKTLKQVLQELYTGNTPSPQLLSLCSALAVSGKANEHECLRRAACLASLLPNNSNSKENNIYMYTQEEKDDALTYFNEVKGICMNRTLVVTEKGFYGLAPLVSRQGDIVCVIIGVDVPFVLKPVRGKGGEEGYRLLGESYAHGVMDGEVRWMVERKEAFVQRVVIY